MTNKNSATNGNFSDAVTLATLRRYIANPPVSCYKFKISPFVAGELLFDHNTGNVLLNQGKIDRFASDMYEGFWICSGHTIKFSDQGRLGDGQNRLEACVQSGMEFETYVAFGISEDALKWVQECDR